MQQQQQAKMPTMKPAKVPGISGVLPKGFTKGLPSITQMKMKSSIKKIGKDPKKIARPKKAPSFSSVQKSVKKTMGY